MQALWTLCESFMKASSCKPNFFTPQQICLQFAIHDKFLIYLIYTGIFTTKRVLHILSHQQETAGSTHKKYEKKNTKTKASC